MNAAGIFALRSHGQGHFDHFMVIMKDMRPHILNHSLVITSRVMVAAGNCSGILTDAGLKLHLCATSYCKNEFLKLRLLDI